MWIEFYHHRYKSELKRVNQEPHEQQTTAEECQTFNGKESQFTI